MKRNKIISILEYSARNKMLVGILAASLIGAGGIFLANNAVLSNNTMGINKIVLAGTVNNDGNKACVINGDDNLVLYTSAESNSNVESYISVGEMLTINSYSNGYYNVTVEETGVTGYISSANMEKIVSGTGDSLTSLNETAYVTNVTSDVNLRAEATMNSTTLLKLTNNTQVTLLGKEGEWYKVDANGTTGYIYEEYIAIANTSASSSSSQSTTTTSNNSNVASSSNTTGTTASNSSSSSTKATSSNSGTSTTGTTIKSTSGTSTTISNTGTSNTTGTTASNSGSSSTKATSLNSGTTVGTTKNTGAITYSVPSNMLTSSAVIVKNTTGKAISESQLDGYLRSWIMVGQNGCSSICDANGTYWAEPWLNKVSQETLYQAFIDANGESALSQNITANELIKATEELGELTKSDVPFTLSQAKALILDMLQKDGYATPSEVTKIVFVKDTGYPSVYQVYTKDSGNSVFWTVEANNGYAQG